MRKTTFATQSLAWFSIQILVNSKILKLLLNLSIIHVRVQIACYELKGDLSPVILDEILPESFENFKITRICRMAKVVFLIQMLPTFGGRWNRYF